MTTLSAIFYDANLRNERDRSEGKEGENYEVARLLGL